MRAWPCVCLVLTACFSPKPVAGTPCTPELANCPDGLTCTLIAGEHVCATGGGDAVDAALTPDTLDGAVVADGPTDGAAVVPWTLVQTDGTRARTVNLPAASRAKNLIVVAIETDDLDAVESISDDADNLYVPVVNSRAINDNQDFGIELWFAKATKPGATQITVTAPNVFAVVAWEFAGLATIDPLDTVAHVDDQAASTSPRGAAITTAADGELVVSAIIVANQVTDVIANNPFTNDHTTNGNGWAHLTSASAPAGTYQARWTQTISGASCATSVAFRTGP